MLVLDVVVDGVVGKVVFVVATVVDVVVVGTVVEVGSGINDSLVLSPATLHPLRINSSFSLASCESRSLLMFLVTVNTST